jgi:hypothetical protein
MTLGIISFLTTLLLPAQLLLPSGCGSNERVAGLDAGSSHAIEYKLGTERAEPERGHLVFLDPPVIM